jgi:hypothetical protein
MTEIFQSKKYTTVPEQTIDYFKIIPQEGVKHKIFDSECRHNAIWDLAISPEGRVFFSLCAELGESQYVRLYEYLEPTNDFKLHFRLEDNIIQQDIAIRASKIHTSMSFMNDGRMIMSTHTTSQAPQHPYWMPYSFYRHQFEGYQGSNIIIYDPVTCKLENRGVPVPFETIYGGAYDSKYNAFYFSGMLRGHFYRFDIATNQVKDLGQGCDGQVYKMSKGPDGHIYTSTRLGRMIRLNVDKQCIEDLEIDIPDDSRGSHTSRMQLGHCVWHPNGKLYFCVSRHDNLFCYDPVTNSLEDMGLAIGSDNGIESMNWPNGIAVDNKGRLWYGVLVNSKGFPGGMRLFCLDFQNSKKPVDYGFIGSSQRCLHVISEMECHDDILYIADSNHQFDPAGVIAVDLSKLSEGLLQNTKPVYSNDAGLYMCVENGRDLFHFEKEIFDRDALMFLKGMEDCEEVWKSSDKNWDTFQCQQSKIVKLWKHVGAEDSKVLKLEWLDDNNLTGICGKNQKYSFKINVIDGLSDLIKIHDYKEPVTDFSEYNKLNLPFVAGRQYKAVATAVLDFTNETKLIGTEDGFLCLYRNGSVFSLGQAAQYGPVHTLSTDKAKSKVYGVASYPMDIGSIFSYDDENGLRQLGRLSFYSPTPDYFANSCEPTTCAVSPDGRHVAFGTIDRLGTVFICKVN